MSQEVSQQNLPSDSSREVLKVTLLGGGWNSSAGGLATFNRELAIHLSQHPKVEVSFLVPDGHCTDKDKREARRDGVTIVSAKKRLGYDPLDWLIAPPEAHNMDVVFGHSAKLGKQIQFIKEFPRFHNCKWVQVVHTAPEDLSKYKGYPDPISKGEEKHKVEVDLCKRADLVVPVGPRLEEAYLAYLQRCKSRQDVFSVIPGLFDREFGDLKQSPNENAEFKVLLCGRGDEEDFELKGYDIAVKAFTDHRLKGKRYHLIFVGAPEGKQDGVRERLLQGGIADDQLTVREFIQSRESMKDLLCEVDLVIMPSKSEGYGLVALEALSAGLPILVSSRAGFARALKNIPVGESCIVDSCDPAKWAEAVEGVGVRHSLRLEEMKYLRDCYGRSYSWKKQCENLVERLWTMVNDEKLFQMSKEINDLKEKLGSHLQNTGTEIKGQDISQKLDQMRTNIETVRKESKVQVDISAKLEQMRREIGSVREEVDIFFRTTTEEIRGEGLKGTENRDSTFIGRQLKDVKGKSHPLKRTISEAFGSALTGSSVMDIQQNVHPAVKCKKIDDVEATGGQSTSSVDRKQLQAAIRSMKANIKTETEQSTDVQQPFRLNPGEGRKPKDLKIDQIYVNVVIHEGRVKYDFPTDRWEQLKVYPQPNTKTSTSVRPQDVIDDKYKNILVVGRPGIGKTMMSTKLLRTWASDNAKMQKQFQVAFLLKFKHLNNETDLSLHELLARSETVESLDGEIWKFVIENPTKVLLIFDGIDEFLARSYISKDDSRYKNGVDKKMPLHALYRKLASGKLLRGATVITTTRPAAAECLNNLTFDRTVEILGFTSEQVKEYVENFTKDDQTDHAKTTIWEHISTNINFFSLCYIPVNCFIICHCLLQIINICTDTARKLPSKITDIYSMYVKIFFFKHNRNDKYSRSTTDLGKYIYKKFDDLQPENDSVFKKLGEVAFNGIKEGRLVFESSEVGDLQDCGLLHRLPDVKSRKLSEPPKPQFCFTHLTVQEFFAAKHLTDTMNKDDLQQFVASHINHGAWQVVMQFVAGLLEPDADQGMSNIDFFADLLPTSTKEQDTLIMWPANDQDKRLALNVCKCLNEVDFEQQNSLQHKTAKIGFNELDFSECSLGPVDCIAITHFIKNSNIAAKCLNFKFNDLGSLSCREICDLVKDHDVNCNLTTLELGYNNIGEQGVAYLCDALKDENCDLKTLDLGYNKIGDQAAAHLCDALKDVNCNLETLDLVSNKIGDQAAAHLCDALKDVNCGLETLDLSDNKIGEQGAAHLCDALTHVNCDLKTLDLSANKIGEQGAAHLCDALKHVNCELTTMILRVNKIGDQGAAHLCDALKHVNCNLETLDLVSNKIGDQGAAHLCDALKDVNCKLSSLWLSVNKIGEQGAAYLSDALKDVNCNLSTLHLSRNKIGDQGAAHLCDALKDVNCNLTRLDLRGSEIGDQGVAYLCDALKDANCNLTALDLSDNNIGDQGAAHLCDALKDANCNLASLDLRGTEIGDQGVAYLCDALKDANCNLTVLDLSDNNIGQQVQAQLSDSLSDVNCTVRW